MDFTDDSTRSKAFTDDDVQSISRSSREHPGHRAEPLPGTRDAVSMEGHRNMMLASLLEDHYRTRAVECLNSTNPGQQFTRQSPEVEALTHQLYTKASRVLSSNGFLSLRATSDEAQRTRHQYLSGLDSLVAGSQAPTILDSMRDMVSQVSHMNLTPHPANDLQLTMRHPPLSPQPRSHYRLFFREDRLLGKGGFGKVYQCYNLLDQNTYAVKKIILPPKLVKSLSDGKHDDLQHILREVKAMALLEHPNIVRYHATWFEEPQQLPEIMSGMVNITNQPLRRGRRLLLHSHPFDGSEEESSSSGGIVFGEDTSSHQSAVPNSSNGDPIIRGWSEEGISALDNANTSDVSESSIFTGGRTDPETSSPGQTSLETGAHALYIQMSLYPLTLAQYISPSSSPNATLRHCFHLAPTLRLVLSIHEGLQYIHSKGFIHRDIKPGNIFLSSPEVTPEGGYCDLSCKLCGKPKEGASSTSRWLNPRIGDFGLVHQLAKGEVPSSSQSSTDSEKDAGTAYYQPPRKGETKDEKIDIFALGVVFIEMLCCCNTAMERVTMLKELQDGKLPAQIRRNIHNEGHDPETEEKVILLASSMTDEDCEKRWSGSQVREALQDLLNRCKD